MAVIDWWNGPLTLVVTFFALCLLLLTWSIAGVACRACHSSGTVFHCDTHTHTHTHTHTSRWGQWALFSSYRQLYLSSFSDTHTHTHTAHTHTHTAHTHTNTHTHTRRGQWALFSLIPSALSFVFLWHASSDSAEVLADAWRRGPADRSWSLSCMIVSRSSWRVSVLSVSFDWREACLPSWCNRKHNGRVSQRYRFESRRGQWALFSLIPSTLSFVFLWHTHTHIHTHTHTHTLSAASNQEWLLYTTVQ